MVQNSFPISFEDALAARDRIRPFLPVTALRHYRELDDLAGGGIQVWVKHENHQPTNAFKVRNGLAVLTAMAESKRGRGVVAASRGNHGLGLAYAGFMLKTPVTICVPEGNNPEKNGAMRGLGATVIEEGRDYDDAVGVAEKLVKSRGLRMVHATNERGVIAGAATLTMEMLEQEPSLDALVFAIGGGSQAVGAITVARALRPDLSIFGVQAAGAPAIHDSWHRRTAVETATADTLADGLATRKPYEMTFDALLQGLAGFVTVTDGEIAEAIRTLLKITHNLAEGAGAAGLAGLLRLRDVLKGRRVGVVLSGSNIDQATLKRVLAGALPA